MSRCWCCADLLDVRGLCPLCDYEGGMVSPPHVCAKSGRLITDEHGCNPDWPTIEPDHETWRLMQRRP